MEHNKTEIILHTMDGCTTTLNTTLSRKEVNQAMFGTNGFNSLIGLGCSDNQNVVINMNNVCFISVTDLGDENGKEGSN